MGKPKSEPQVSAAAVGADRLRAFVERVERLEEEKRELAADVKEVYAEAKGEGFDTATMRRIVALRRKPPEQRQEEEALLDLYLSALGMLPFTETPLGAAVKDLGTPVEPTDEERAAGVTAAFVRDGTRMTIAAGGRAA